MIKGQMLIGGKWISADSGDKIDVVNPALGEVFAQVPKAHKEDIDKAIDAANSAFKAWASLSPFARGNYLRKASRLVEERKEEIAKLMTQEQGKPFQEALGEVEKGADILTYYAEEGERIYGRIVPNVEQDMESRVIYQPIGVAAAISPWNYPIELLAWKIGGALASGCTMIAKLPSETPLSPLAFVKCVQDAGVPTGVINAITGSGSEVGPILFDSKLVKKIAFTGSTDTGRQVLRGCVDTFKKVSLELGGSLPTIVCKDCNLDQAVKGAVRRSFRNMGQICIAINRIYVDENIYEEFMEKFVEETKKLTIGDGLKEEVNLGPMCTMGGVNTAKQHIEDALAKGAKLAYGGHKPQGKKYEKGFYFEPTILRDVTHDMLVMQEETFGPVVGVMPFSSIEEAVELANDSVYGLAAIVFTESLSLANYLSKNIEAGNVAINNVDAGVLYAPYGGWKDSGFGHEHGPEGLYEYLLIKHIRVKYL